VFRSRHCLIVFVVALTTSMLSCNDDTGDAVTPSQSSVSVPIPAEEVALSAPVKRVLGRHAVELGDTHTLVIVIDGVPSSVPPGVEVRATGSVRTYRRELGAELGIHLDHPGMEQLEGTECLVVAQLEILEQA
jgi:hypothetical protein